MKILKKLSLVIIVFFSFYYTEKISKFVLEKNELYQEINKKKDKYKIASIDAITKDNYVIPGLNGKKVDLKNSYYNMKDINEFNPYYLVYKETVPKETIYNYKDKIINKGNNKKNSISLVVEYDEGIIKYLNKYNISVLVNLNNFKKDAKYEQINNEESEYKKLDKLISRYSINTDICLVNKNNNCKKYHKTLVEPTKELNNENYYLIKNSLSSGDIILINKNTNIKYINLLIKDILYKDYQINYLSKHISEERN